MQFYMGNDPMRRASNLMLRVLKKMFSHFDTFVGLIRLDAQDYKNLLKNNFNKVSFALIQTYFPSVLHSVICSFVASSKALVSGTCFSISIHRGEMTDKQGKRKNSYAVSKDSKLTTQVPLDFIHDSTGLKLCLSLSVSFVFLCTSLLVLIFDHLRVC